MTTTWQMPSGSGDRWPDDYERGRPGWPIEAVRAAGVPRAATVLDLGAGTGKLTRLLEPEFEQVVAVEPSGAMLGVLAVHCREVAAVSGTAHAIPVADSSVDAVFAAQSFHWFDDEPAVAEIARVLRPGGVLVALWNRPAGPWEPDTAAAEAVLAARMPSEVDHIPLDLGGPDASSGWRPVASSPFGPFEATELANPQSVDRDGLVAFYASMGWVGDLPDDERAPLLQAVRLNLGAASYRRTWETHVHWARLRA